MANPGPQAPAARPDPRARAAGLGDAMKTLWDTMWFPLLLFFGFCLC